MKELSIEEKAKRYDEAIEKFDAILNLNTVKESGTIFADDVRKILPELKESEDERIRKELIEHIKANKEVGFVLFQKFSPDDVIAWLEKQGDIDRRIQEEIEKQTKQQCKTEKQGETMKVKSEIVKDYIGEENVWNNARDFRPEHMKRCLCYDKYMGGVYCYVYDGISKYWCTQTTEEHDPDGDNHICDYADYRVTVWMSLPRTPFYPEKQCEQKPTDKVEPKFKVGDWVVASYGEANQVITVDEDGDAFTLDDGTYFSGSWKDGYHLWAIQDAKDGDILVDGTFVGIFKENSYNPSDNSGCMFLYCSFDINNDKFYLESGGYNPTYFYPATKEQRGLLFQKMKEAGYEWNAEKKELKKIHVIDEGKSEMDYCFTKMMNGEKVSSVWTEEDEYLLGETIQHLEELIRIDKAKHCACDVQYYQRDIDWLKTLKERMKGE